jgi:hypothetical protein
MYQLNETEIWREQHHELLREAEHHTARRNQRIRPYTGLRVVRVPGGFAYVDE